MRIAVIGAGGVGGFFGGALARAGNDVTFVARGRHLDAIREHGLRVETAVGAFTVAPARAVGRLDEVGRVDIAMLCVKLWDVEATAPLLAPLLGRSGMVIPFQNGVDSPAMLRRSLGADRVLGGVAYMGATIRVPGVIAHTGTMAKLVVGAFEPAQQPQAAAFAATCTAAGIECDLTGDIERALWRKYVFLAAMSGCTSLARQPVGIVRSDPDLRAVFETAMREAVAVARARGIDLGPEFVDQQLAFIDTLPATMRSSMLNDLVAGNRLEAPWLSGGIARMAREAGRDAPVNATIYAALKPYVDGAAP